MRNGKWRYTVRGYASRNHPKGAPPGSLLLETTHRDKHSRDLEVWAWLSRIVKGDGVEHIEIISHVPPFWSKTIYNNEAKKFLTPNKDWIEKDTFSDEDAAAS